MVEVEFSICKVQSRYKKQRMRYRKNPQHFLRIFFSDRSFAKLKDWHWQRVCMFVKERGRKIEREREREREKQGD